MTKYYYALCSLALFIILCMGSNSYSYTFGLLSHNDTIESIENIEAKHNIKVPMVGFIRDSYDAKAVEVVSQLNERLGTGRVYHITLSPEHRSAKDVYLGYFDWEYKLFFNHVKTHNLKVVFRTMHEMNGGRYPWAGDPLFFKRAWIHIHNLSREAGLDQNQILFDFSTNGRDMPTAGATMPHQQATLTKCTIQTRNHTGCFSREDYYPGDKYVDIMGVTFYNRGKATSNRQWQTPAEIMEESQFTILKRLKAKNKPIIIDEVGSTSVRYTGSYNRNTSLQHYRQQLGKDLKNAWIQQLATRASSHPEIAALSYFNVDVTMGLAWENPGEADRSAIDLDNNRYYHGIMDLYQGGDQGLHRLFISSGTKTDTINKPIITTGSITHNGSSETGSQTNKQWWKR